MPPYLDCKVPALIVIALHWRTENSKVWTGRYKHLPDAENGANVSIEIRVNLRYMIKKQTAYLKGL
jgi:hypothetical protein